jgi:hypothetical protein
VLGEMQATGLRPTFLYKFEKRGIELPGNLFGAPQTFPPVQAVGGGGLR